MLQHYRMKRKRTFNFDLLLYRYMPTPKDTERYLSFKGSPSDLHVVDQFMLEVRGHSVKRHHMLFLVRSLLDKTTAGSCCLKCKFTISDRIGRRGLIG